MTKPRFQERCARWLLLLTILHTVPAVWVIPVAGGTAPAMVLLAYGAVSLLSLEKEDVFLGVLVLGPALIYAAAAWGLAWLAARKLQQIRPPVRHWLLALPTVALLGIVYFPVYVEGGHNSSRNVNLITLFENTFSETALVWYWAALHVVSASLYVGHILGDDHPVVGATARWRKPIRFTAVISLVSVLLLHSYPVLICRPLAGLGSSHAQVCVAKSTSREQRYWYERAANSGNAEAITWLIDHSPYRRQRLVWLRKGAEWGDAATQFALFQALMGMSGSDNEKEAGRWLDQAAGGGYGPAQFELAEMLSREIYRTQSRDLLAERNALLERAAENGSRTAKIRLAQHYSSGSMGYPVDLAKARAYYEGLADAGELTDKERKLQYGAVDFQQRLAELDAWERGLQSRDLVVSKTLASRFLRSQLPGPGVRDLGISLLDRWRSVTRLPGGSLLSCCERVQMG